MKYFKTKMIVLSLILIALWTGIATANEPVKYYTAAIAVNTDPLTVKQLALDVKWVSVDKLENIISIFNIDVEMSQALYKENILNNDVIKTKSGIYNVKFIKEFQGFWIYEVFEMYKQPQQLL